MANYVAVQMDRRGLAEMSCIAGVGGDVPSLLKTARSPRPIVVIDGCVLECARQCLLRHGIDADTHIQLAQEGVRKKYHQDYDVDQAEEIINRIAARVKISDPETG